MRRDLIRRYGEKTLYEGGLASRPPCCPGSTWPAQENVDFSLRKLDKRQGWRGPEAHLAGPAADEFRRRVAALYGDEPPVEGQLYLGLVEGATADGAKVRVGGRRLPAAVGEHAVGRRPTAPRTRPTTRSSTRTVGALRAGDVVWVRTRTSRSARRFTDLTYDGKSEVQWLPAYDETPKPSRRSARRRSS